MSDLNWQFLWLWIASIAIIILVVRTNAKSASGSVGLPFAFLISLAFLHCGSIIYAVPGYSHWRSSDANILLYLQAYNFGQETVLRGTFATFLGVLGFGVGSVSVSARQRRIRQDNGVHLITAVRRKQLLMVLLGLGGIGFLLSASKVNLPMSQALSQVLRNLAIAGVCLGPAMIVLMDRRYTYTHWICVAALIPATYVVVFGFTSLGFISLSIIASFWLCALASRRISIVRVALGSTAILAFALSAFVGWMSFRDRIREVVWSGGSIADRLEVITQAIGSIELLRPSNFASLDFLNLRLNQNIFIGKAMELHEISPHLKLYGENLLLIPFALVPRFLWSGKPQMGGSAMLETHTGIQFSEGVTFGAGPILELFVNFGLWGVFFGMMLLGLVVRWIDVKASSGLRSYDFLNFARWFTVGIAFVAPLSELFFMFNAAMMSFITLTGLNILLSNREKNRRTQRLVSGRATHATLANSNVARGQQLP